MTSNDATSATNQKLLMDTIGKINTMVSSVSSSCDPGSQCYITKTKNELLQIYNDAKSTEATAPADKEIAKENYYKFILGDEYPQFQKKEVEKKASVFISGITSSFFTALNKTIVTLEDYINILNDIKYAKTLDSLIEGDRSSTDGSSTDGTALSKTLGIYAKKTNNMTNLNERKVYYEQENYESLLWWYKLWLYTYLFLLVVFLISIFLVDNKNSFMTNMGILTLFVAYIFITKPILYFIVYIVKQINSFLPKNVYLSLNS
jgi:hypothetical protein